MSFGGSGPLLLLLFSLALLLLLSRLALLRRFLSLLLLLLNSLTLSRHFLPLLLLRRSLIARLQRGWSPHVAIRRKRLIDRRIGRTAMIHTCKLRSVGAGGALVFHLRRHGSGMWRTQRGQLSGSRPHLDPTRTAVEAYTRAAPAAAVVAAIAE